MNQAIGKNPELMMEDSSFSEIIDKAINNIQESFEKSIQNFKGHMDEESSGQALNELIALQKEIEAFDEKLGFIVNSSKKLQAVSDNEILQNFHKDIETVNERIENLKRNVERLNEISSSIVKDASVEEMVEIIDALPKTPDVWSIKIRSPDINEGNFRNITIWDVELNQEVGNIILLEPGIEIKIHSHMPLTVAHHLVAKIDERYISFPYRIPKIKISNVSIDNNIEVTIKNLTGTKIENAIVVYNNMRAPNELFLDPYEISVFAIDDNLKENANFYIEKEEEIIAPIYEYKTIQEGEDKEEILRDLNEFQRNMADDVYISLPNLSYLMIKARILQENPNSAEGLIQSLRKNN